MSRNFEQGERSLSFSFWIIACAVLALFLYQTRQRNELWRDPIKLWSDVVQKYPNKPRAWISLGVAERHAGNDDLALAVFKETIRRFEHTDFGSGPAVYAKVDIAAIQMHRGHMIEAQAALEQILVAQRDKPIPEALSAYNNLAFIYAVSRRPEEALALLDTLISYDDSWKINASANYNRGLAFQAMHNCKEALGAFRMAKWIDHAVQIPACEYQ